MNAPAPARALAVRTGRPRPIRGSTPSSAPIPTATIFHLPQWSRAVERGCRPARALSGRRAAAARCAACLPLTEIRSRLFGNALVSAGFGTGGGILADDGAPPRRSPPPPGRWPARSAAPRVELRGGAGPGGLAGERRRLCQFRPRPARRRRGACSPRSRAASAPRCAARSDFGLETSAGSDRRHRDAHYRVYAESVRNLGTPVFPRAPVRGGARRVRRRGRHRHRLEGRPRRSPPCSISTSGGTCQPFWGGGTRAARAVRAPTTSIYYEVMRRAIARGCTRADFGRSKVGTGPWARKRIWGFEETPLVYAVRTADGARRARSIRSTPNTGSRSPPGSKLPLWLANRLGPLIARGLG